MFLTGEILFEFGKCRTRLKPV